MTMDQIRCNMVASSILIQVIELRAVAGSD
jgi:hypothetical protein